jgi:PKD repeat protein
MQKIFTVFLTLIAFTGVKSQCTDLFISEYLEGSASNKAIEIYNPTMAPVNLADYSIRLYSNGSATPTSSVTLTGTLNPFSTFVICHGSSNATILGLANQTSSGTINFNGDDVVELMHFAAPIDRFGVIGVDPGTSWTISGNPLGSVNKTLVRKQNVQMGDLTWTGTGEDQWIIYNQDVTNYLDLHVMNTCGSTLTGTGSGGALCHDVVSSFTANGSGGAGSYSYIWDYGDGTAQGTTATVNHTFAAAGTYNITYVIYDIAFNVYSETFSLTVNPAPTACATVSSNTGCAPANICFTDCSTGAVLYNWDFGDGGNATTASPCYDYSVDGSYTASLITINAFDCDDTTTIAITIDPSGDASFDYAQNSYCTLDANPTPNITGNTGGTFSCNGCVIDANSGLIDISATTTGNYTVTYTEGISPCEDVQTFDLSISSSAPDPTINAVSPMCTADANIILTAANSGGIWSASCGACINSTTGEFSPSTAGAGSHTITYAFTGSCASTDTETALVTLTADATINPVNPVCVNVAPFNLTAVNSGGTWSGPGITNPTLGTFDPVISGAGSHIVTYTISGTCGDSKTTTVVIYDLPNPTFSADVTNGCLPLAVIFTDNTSPSSVSVSWSATDGFNSTSSGSVSHTFNTAGCFDVTLTSVNANGCSNDVTYSNYICVADIPVAEFTSTTTLGVTDFTDASIDAVVYNWDFDGLGTSTQQNPSFTFSSNGTYNVCLTVESVDGCTDVVCHNVVVTGLGLREHSSVKMNVYPNPSNGNFTIESNSNITRISVKNVIGQNVFSKNVNANNTQISLEDVNNGFYFIELETENGKAVKRIEITK